MSLMFNDEVLTLLNTPGLNSASVKFPPLILEALSSNPRVGSSSPILGRLKDPLSVIGGCVKIIKSKLMSVSSHYTRSRSVAKVLLPLCVGINLGKTLRALRPLRVFPRLIPPHSGVKSFTTSLHLCNVPLHPDWAIRDNY